MKYARRYGGGDGQSHFEFLEMPLVRADIIQYSAPENCR